MKYSVICGIWLLHSFCFEKHFHCNRFNLHNHSLRFGSSEPFLFIHRDGDGDSGLPGIAGSFLDQGQQLSPLPAQLTPVSGSHSQQKKGSLEQLLLQRFLLKAHIPAHILWGVLGRSQGNFKVHDKLVVKGTGFVASE